MDILSPEKRSWTMSRIRSRDTKPELIVRRFLFSQGFRYRIAVKSLPGKPDIVLKKYRIAIFIHGCFWHGHECLKGKLPQSHEKFWSEKLTRNKERDQIVRQKLRELGWNTLIVWECQLKPQVREKTLNEIVYWINESLLSKYRKTSTLNHEMERTFNK